MSGQLATSETILVSAAGVIAADSAGLSSVKSYSALLTSIAAMPLAGGTFTGNVLFTDNTYDIGASGATRPRTVYAGTSVITPLVNNPSAALTLGNATYGVTSAGQINMTGSSAYITSGGEIIAGCDSSGFYFAGGLAAVNRHVNIGNSGAATNTRILNNATLIGTTTDASTGKLQVAGNVGITGTVLVGSYTVATLPSAASNAGRMAQVTDSNAAASGNYGATVAGGGSNRVKVFSDGTNWVIA